MNFPVLFANYWWILIILISLLFYKSILRVFFGMVIVPENRIGLVAEKIMAIGKSARIFLSGDNFTRFKITEEIGKGSIKIMPDLIVSGSNGSEGPLSGVLGLQLLQMLQENKNQNGNIKD